MKKRIISILALVLIFAFMMTGCGGPKKVTAQSLLEGAQAKTEAANSMEGKMTMEMTIESEDMAALGGSMALSMDMDMQTTTDPVASYMTGSVNMMGFGMDMDIYTVVEDGKLCNYMKVMDQWMVQRLDFDESMMEAVDSSAKDLLKNIDSLTLAEETKDVDGKEAYIISGTIEGEDVQNLMNSATSSLGGVMGNTDQIDLSGMTVDVEYAVGKEDGLPIYTNMKFGGMKSSAEGVEVNISDMTANLTYTGFGTVESIAVPQEAIDNAQDITELTEEENAGEAEAPASETEQ